MINPTGISWTT